MFARFSFGKFKWKCEECFTFKNNPAKVNIAPEHENSVSTPWEISPQSEINASDPQNIEALEIEKRTHAKPLKHQRNIRLLMCKWDLAVVDIAILRIQEML